MRQICQHPRSLPGQRIEDQLWKLPETGLTLFMVRRQKCRSQHRTQPTHPRSRLLLDQVWSGAFTTPRRRECQRDSGNYRRCDFCTDTFAGLGLAVFFRVQASSGAGFSRPSVYYWPVPVGKSAFVEEYFSGCQSLDWMDP